MRIITLLALITTVLGAEEVPTVAERPTYLADLSQAMAIQWPKNRTITIVCHGHSVPTGYFKTPVIDTFNAYPHLLHVGLKQRFPYAAINVIVTGIGGENAESGAKRFADDVLTHKPDLVTIDYALNDRGIGLERAKAAWTAMIDQAATHHVRLILLTPTPDQGAKLDDPMDPLNLHAEQIRRLAAEHHLALVDSLASFKDYVARGNTLASAMSQSNHPNRMGHDLVAAGLLMWFP